MTTRTVETQQTVEEEVHICNEGKEPLDGFSDESEEVGEFGIKEAGKSVYKTVCMEIK